MVYDLTEKTEIQFKTDLIIVHEASFKSNDYYYIKYIILLLHCYVT